MNARIRPIPWTVTTRCAGATLATVTELLVLVVVVAVTAVSTAATPEYEDDTPSRLSLSSVPLIPDHDTLTVLVPAGGDASEYSAIHDLGFEPIPDSHVTGPAIFVIVVPA